MTETPADVAPDPTIDTGALERWMDAQSLPGSGSPLTARYISGGASNEIFELRRGDERMALRKPPAKVPKGRNEIMLREYRVIHALNGTDVPHPEGIAVCEDTDVLGSCFYIMGHVDGQSPGAVLGEARAAETAYSGDRAHSSFTD